MSLGMFYEIDFPDRSYFLMLLWIFIW